VTAKYFELAARLDRTPVDGVDGRRFRYATFAVLFKDSAFDAMAKAWHSLDTGQPQNPWPQSDENVAAGELYMTCDDSRWPTSVQTYQRQVAIDRVQYPMYGAAAADIQPCAFWRDPIEPPVRIDDRGPSNVLMAQNLRDPVTPLASALQMRQALGDRARMVTADQGGHGVYLVNANQCANNAVTTFLTTGRRPAHDLACAAESP